MVYFSLYKRMPGTVPSKRSRFLYTNSYLIAIHDYLPISFDVTCVPHAPPISTYVTLTLSAKQYTL
jgi:hypothetical protein